MPKQPRRRVSFVTGINENYFLMCGMLMESLDRHFPLIPFFVMDFGLSGPQKEFFRRRDMLLPLPPGLHGDDHPFKLKGNLGAFLGEDFGVPVWIDADIIALRDGTQAVFALAEQMAEQDLRFALAPDQSLPGINAPTLSSNSNATGMPALAAFVREHPHTAQRAYLNTGVVMFREGDPLADWAAATAAFDGDLVWEQNAFNSLCHLDIERVRMLDARIWNAHSGLLEAMKSGAQGIECDGAPCIFAHATSSGPQITWGEMDFVFAGSPYRNFVKFFAHPVLNELQKGYMTSFLSGNLAQLRELGILRTP